MSVSFADSLLLCCCGRADVAQSAETSLQRCGVLRRVLLSLTTQLMHTHTLMSCAFAYPFFLSAQQVLHWCKLGKLAAAERTCMLLIKLGP